MVGKISKLGTSGKHAKNCERDFHSLLKTFSKRLGAKISTIHARMYNHAEARVEWQPLSIIFPDDMAAALFNRGGRVWQHTMFGDKAPDEVLAFWQHCKQHCDWFKGSKCFNYPVLEKLIPFSIYGDDIAAYKGSETGMVTVLGWTSDLAFLNGSWTRYWPITVYAEYAATEWTYNDIMSHVVRRLHGMFDTEVVHDWTADGYMFRDEQLAGRLEVYQRHVSTFMTTGPILFAVPAVRRKTTMTSAWPWLTSGPMLHMPLACQIWVLFTKIAPWQLSVFQKMLVCAWPTLIHSVEQFCEYFASLSLWRFCGVWPWGAHRACSTWLPSFTVARHGQICKWLGNSFLGRVRLLGQLAFWPICRLH